MSSSTSPRRVLQPGGLLHSWTDVEDYFEVIRALMDHHAAFETLPPPSEQEPTHDLDYQTSFERRRRQDRRDDLSRVVAQTLSSRRMPAAGRIGPLRHRSDRIGRGRRSPSVNSSPSTA